MNVVIGAIAQLGERNTGSVEVGGSIPPSSTKLFNQIDIRYKMEELCSFNSDSLEFYLIY